MRSSTTPGHATLVYWVGYRSFTNPWTQQSTWYRVFGPGQALRSTGAWDVEYLSLDEASRLSVLIDAGVVAGVILHRVPLLPHLAPVFDRCEKAGIPTCFDIDDNVLSATSLNSAASTGRAWPTPRSKLEYVARTYQLAAAACGRTVCATGPLAEVAGQFASLREIVPNYLPEFYFARPPAAAAHEGETNYTIFYGPGSLEHRFHLEFVDAQIARFLATHPEVRMVLGGGVPLTAGLARFSDRVECIPRLPPSGYLCTLGTVDCVLAPLRLTEFSRCKSWVKALEAAVQGADWLGSRVPDYIKFQELTQTGTLVEDAEWEEALACAYREREIRKERARAARQRIRDDFSWNRRVSGYLRILGYSSGL